MLKSQSLYIVQTGKTDAFFESSEVEFVAWLLNFWIFLCYTVTESAGLLKVESFVCHH